MVFFGDEKVGREQSHFIHMFDALTADWVHVFNALHFIAPETDAVVGFRVRGKNIYGIAFYAKATAFELGCSSGVEGVNKGVEQGLAGDGVAYF